jgi:hypothetical protein
MRNAVLRAEGLEFHGYALVDRYWRRWVIRCRMASGTSKETELKLTNVARASLEELLEDYRDFLRTRQAQEWNKNSKEALFVRTGHWHHSTE